MITQNKMAMLHYEDEEYHERAQVSKKNTQQSASMVEYAKEVQIPIQEDPLLLNHLTNNDFKNDISPQLFGLMAETIALFQKIESGYKG